MWRIVKGEFLYHRFLFAFFLSLTPLAVLYQTYGLEDAPGTVVFIWLLMFLTVNTWVSLKAKEKRDALYVQFPLPVWQVGLARLMVVLLTCLGISALYALIYQAARPGNPLSPRPFLVTTTAILFLYSVVFIVRDQILGNRYLRDAKLWIMLGLALMVLGNVYLLIATREIRATGQEPPLVFKVAKYLFTNHPFSTTGKTLVSVLITAALAALSVRSFSRRKTHVG